MKTPGEIKFMLEARLLALAQGGVIPMVTGIHSITVEGDDVFAGFDVVPGDEILFFEYPRPATVGRDRDAICSFTAWLAWGSYGETSH